MTAKIPATPPTLFHGLLLHLHCPELPTPAFPAALCLLPFPVTFSSGTTVPCSMAANLCLGDKDADWWI